MDLSYQVQNMLKLLKDSKTRVEINNDVKKEEYNFMSDTIYISTDTKKIQKGLESANPFCLKLIAMYKSCFKSKQTKLLHVTDVMLSNISLVTFAMTVLFRIMLGRSRGVCLLTAIVILLSAMLKLFMNANAYKRACKHIKKNLAAIGDKDITKENMNNVEKAVEKNKVKLIINKTKYRLSMLVIVLLLMI